MLDFDPVHGEPRVPDPVRGCALATRHPLPPGLVAVATGVGRAALAVFAAATLAFVIFGFANAQPRSPGDAVRGEFRLGPGNQQPPGYVIPLG